ncbi:MAG: hypothetical protein WC365_05605 [Candidatus Babeliales bacterium]|jgi:hypothetical protein
MQVRFFSAALLGLIIATASAATPTQRTSDTSRLKELSVQLTTELEALVEGFVATAQQMSNCTTKEKIQTLPTIIASLESIKQAGQRIGATNNQAELTWLNFALQEVLNGIKRASLKLHLLDAELSPVGFDNIGHSEHSRIQGDIYAYLLSWLQHQCIQQTHTLMVIDNKTISSLIRASARKSFRWWWVIQKIRLARNIFDVDLYDSAPGLVDEYFAFIKACNNFIASNDDSIEQILISSKLLLAHCVDKKAEFEHTQDSRTITVIDALMNSVTLTCQKLTLSSPHKEDSDPEQTVPRFISSWANKNIIQPFLKKYGVSALQYFLSVMKETPQPAQSVK